MGGGERGWVMEIDEEGRRTGEKERNGTETSESWVVKFAVAWRLVFERPEV